MVRACVSPLGVGEHGVHAGRGPGVRVLYRTHVSGSRPSPDPSRHFPGGSERRVILLKSKPLICLKVHRAGHKLHFPQRSSMMLHKR